MTDRDRGAFSEVLSREDLERALGFAGRVQAAENLDSFRRRVLEGLLELIDGNIASYNEIEFATGAMFTLTEPEMRLDHVAIFDRLKDQNPLIAYHRDNDDVGPNALSDLIGEADFHATDVYRRFYSLYGIEDQIVTRLPAPEGYVIAVVVNRQRRGFSERERELLRLVRPHALQSFRMAQQVEESRREIAGLRDRLAGRGLLLDADRFGEREGLSPRQREVMGLLVRGATTDEIAAELQISRSTVLKHVENIRASLGVHSRVELLARLLAGGQDPQREDPEKPS